MSFQSINPSNGKPFSATTSAVGLKWRAIDCWENEGGEIPLLSKPEVRIAFVNHRSWTAVDLPFGGIKLRPSRGQGCSGIATENPLPLL